MDAGIKIGDCPVDEQSDLAHRAAGGDRKAFAQLMAGHYDQIYGLAYKKVGHKETAEEIAQTACMKIGRNIAKFRGDAKFSTWAYRITMNCVHDWGRGCAATHDKDHVPFEDCLNAGDDDPHKQAEIAEVWRAVTDLPPPKDECVRLVFAEGYTQKETAALLDIKENTVAWHIAEAKKLLAMQFTIKDPAHG